MTGRISKAAGRPRVGQDSRLEWKALPPRLMHFARALQRTLDIELNPLRHLGPTGEDVARCNVGARLE